MARGTDRDGIQELGPRRFRVVVETGRTPEGKRGRIQKVIHGSRRDAERYRRELLAKQDAGLLLGSSDQSLSSYLESWLETKRHTVSTRTFERYQSLSSSLMLGLGGIALGKLTTQHINNYYTTCLSEVVRPRKGRSHRKASSKTAEEKRTLSPATIKHRHVVLKMALRAAVEDGIIPRNPAQRAAVPRPSRRELCLIDESQAALLLDAAQATPLGLVVWLALHSGARIGEILALRWEDVDFERGVMMVRRTLAEHLKRVEGREWFEFKEPKSGHGRTVELDQETLLRLKKAKAAQAELRLVVGQAWQDYGLVFPREDGSPQRPSNVSGQFRQLVRTCGLEGMRFHDLRHAHATLLLRQGFAPHVVQRRLGHSDPALTLRVYAGVLPNQEREAADAFADSLRRALGH